MADYLTRSFFEEELEGLVAAYGQETGGRTASVELMLRNGVALKVEGKPTCTDTYIAVNYKSGAQLRRAVLPYSSIVGVGFTTDHSDKKLGFHG
jgi:hypothetical protein